MSKYKGLFTFDEENHRYTPIAQADGIIDTMDYVPDSKSDEPLIKDSKVRKAVRAWAEAVGVDKVIYENSGWHYEYFRTEPDEYDHAVDIDFWHKLDADLCSGNTYTITELCGEGEE